MRAIRSTESGQRKRPWRYVAVLSIVAMLAAACGGTADEEPEEDPAAEETEEPDDAAEAEEPAEEEETAEPAEEPDAAAVEWPSEPLEFIVPYSPGGSVDPPAREFVRQLTETTGTDVVVENVAGAGGTIGAAEVITSEPNGLVIGNAVNTGLAFQPLVNSDLPWKSADDYTPLGSLGSSPATFFVAADSEWDDFGELMDHARENPGEITVSTPGAFTLGDITTEQVNYRAETELTTVPFSEGAGEAVAAVIGGHVTAYAGTYSGGARGAHLDGELKALVVMDTEAYEPLPDVPLITEYIDDIDPIGFEIFLIAPLIEDEALLAAMEEQVAAILGMEEFQAWQREQALVPHTGGVEESRERLNKEQENFQSVLTAMEARGRA